MASAVLVGAIRYKSLSVGSRRMLVFLIVTLIIEVIAYWVGHIYRSNLIVYHFSTIIQFLLFTSAFASELPRYRSLFRVIQIGGILGGTISLLIYRHQLTTVFPTTFKIGTDILSVIIILLYLRKLITQPTIHPFEQYPLFWISLGWLLLIMLTSVGLSTFNYISNQIPDYAMLFQQIRMVADYQLYTLFGVAFLSQQRSLSQPNG